MKSNRIVKALKVNPSQLNKLKLVIKSQIILLLMKMNLICQGMFNNTFNNLEELIKLI